MFRLPMSRRKAKETTIALTMLSKDTLHRIVIDKKVYIVDEGGKQQLLRPLPRSTKSNFRKEMFGRVVNR